MIEAIAYKKLKKENVACQACSHFCLLSPGQTGRCGIRQNQKGRLISLVGYKVAACNIDPVEKKPLYHFLPATRTLSIGTAGCNFVCAFCQNHNLAQVRPSEKIFGQEIPPQHIVQTAKDYKLPSLSYTYSEPTVFLELVYATGELAAQSGLKNILVSNGFASKACLELFNGIIHAANIDLKSFSDDFYQRYCGARLRPVLDSLVKIKEMGWWLEVTTLLIPGVNDSKAELRELSQFIVNFLGKDTPWHISRFHPCHEMTSLPPTPANRLLSAREIGQQAGLHFVYLGNTPDLQAGDTYCNNCKELLISRAGFTARLANISEGSCQRCGHTLPGIFPHPAPSAGTKQGSAPDGGYGPRPFCSTPAVSGQKH